MYALYYAAVKRIVEMLFISLYGIEWLVYHSFKVSPRFIS